MVWSLLAAPTGTLGAAPTTAVASGSGKLLSHAISVGQEEWTASNLAKTRSLGDGVRPAVGTSTFADGTPALPITGTLPATPPDAAAGLAAYGEHCAKCHGTLGRGDGEMADRLPKPPPSFADPAYMRGVSPAQAFDVVTNGRIESLMPPWKDSLDEQARWDVLYGAWSYYYTPERLARGKAVWSARCASCHGPGSQPGILRMADTGWMAERSQADLFGLIGLVRGVEQAGGDVPTADGAAAIAGPTAAANPVPTDAISARAAGGRTPTHPALDDVDEASLWSALDYARGGTFKPLPFEGLATNGVIVGQVANGTAGHSGLQGAVVRLLPFFQDGLPGEAVTATMAVTGGFTVSNALAGPEVEYRAVASYAGADYIYPRAITLSADRPLAQLSALTVFEASTDVTLTARSENVILSPAPAEGVIHVADVSVLTNASDRTRVSALVPGPVGGDRPTGVDGGAVGASGDRPETMPAGTPLRLELLPGAFDISFGDPRMRGTTELVGDTLLDHVPVPPGEREVLVSYSVPYTGTEYVFARTVNLLTGEFALIAPAAGMTVTSSTLGEVETVSVPMEGHAQAVLRAKGRGLVPGQLVTARVSGLPPATASAAPAGETGALAPVVAPVISQSALAGMALALAGMGILICMRFPNRSGQRDTRMRALRLAESRRHVVAEIAALDRAFRDGQMPEPTYRARRAHAFETAMGLLRAETELDADSERTVS